MKPSALTFKKAQMQILLLCITAYTISYLCRTNLSLVLEDLIGLLQINRSAAGLLGTAYFWTYATGQLISGWLGGKISHKSLVAMGLLLSALSNGLIAFCGAYVPIFLLWMVNGFALSLLWPPIVATASKWFTPAQYPQIAIFLNLPTTVGFIISWGALGAAKNVLDWRAVFYLPAIASALFCVVWILFAKGDPAKAGFSTPLETGGTQGRDPTDTPLEKDTGAKPANGSLKKILFTLTMFSFAVVLIVQGAVRESINLWAPTLLGDLGHTYGSAAVTAATMALPAFSTVGLLGTGRALKKMRGGFDRVLALLLSGGAIAGWLLVLRHASFGVTLVVMGFLLAVLYGTTAMLTTLLPLRFAATGYSGQITGILNFLAYVGAAFGGLLSGLVSDMGGWEGVYVLWASLGTAALLVIGLAAWRHNRNLNRAG